ncbi:MAG TPA: DUF3426 domain-containing protein [Rhizomicrobium sp.]|nr:DUF3426 domain-containing protein [Rhizomicrobium sp.]
MILTCPACQTRYQIDAAKFPPQGRTVRCAKCGEVWHQSAPEPEPQAAPPPPASSYAEPEPVAQSYVTAPERELVRDGGPQVDKSAAESPAPEPSARPRRVGLWAGWAALAAFVIVIGAAAGFFRQQIVHAWPQTASLYSRFGVKVSATGLDIHNIKYTEEPQDGQIILTVTGTLKNVSGQEQPVPQVRVGLVDRDQRELYHWTFAPDVMTLGPGQSHGFVTRLKNPPGGARDLVVRFAKAGE